MVDQVLDLDMLHAFGVLLCRGVCLGRVMRNLDYPTRVQAFLRISVIVSDLFTYLPGNLSVERADRSWCLEARLRLGIPSTDVCYSAPPRSQEHNSPNHQICKSLTLSWKPFRFESSF